MIISKTVVFSGTNVSELILIPEGARVERCFLMLNASLAAHAADYLTFNVRGSDSVTAIATQTTNSSGGVSLTGLTAVELSLTNADKQGYSAGQFIKLEVDKNGTPAHNVVFFGIKLAYDRD